MGMSIHAAIPNSVLTEQLTEIVKSLILSWVLLPVKSSHTILGLADICSLSLYPFKTH